MTLFDKVKTMSGGPVQETVNNTSDTSSLIDQMIARLAQFSNNPSALPASEPTKSVTMIQGNKTTTEDQVRMDDLCEQLGSIEMNTGESQQQNMAGKTQTANPAFPMDALRVYTQDLDGDTLLHTAIIIKDAFLSMVFVSMAPMHTWLSLKNRMSQTPLHLAAITNQVRVVRRLVVGGADIESRDKEGNTPLHIACREGYLDMVYSLLEPVRYNESKQNGYEIPYQKIPQNLEITNYDGKSCLHLATEGNHLSIVKMFLQKGANVNSKDGKTGRTILHCACMSGNTELVRLLLKSSSCDINAKSYDGWTPFDFARAAGHSQIAVDLAVAGAKYTEEMET